MMPLPPPARPSDQLRLPNFRVEMNFLRIASALLLWPMPVAAPGIGSATFVEGALHLIRGTSVLRGAEGMGLRQGDIFETADKGFVQLEFAGGTVVALGPASRLYILRHSEGRAVGRAGTDAADFVLLAGWLKAESNAATGTYRYECPLLSASVGSGSTVVIHSYEGQCDLFVESGSAAIGQVSPDGNSRQPVTGKAGQFFSRRTGKDLTSLSRSNPGFRDGMPAAFRDTLPSRLAHFADKAVEPKTDHAVSYAEIQPWLMMPASWRRGFVERFAPRLKDPEFRKQLEAHLAQYPEWDPILHPEKHPSENAPAPSS
jgi:hypothetical protein